MRCLMPVPVARAALALALSLAAAGAQAQGRGCAITAYTDPPREVLACPDGLQISAEKGAEYRLIDRDRDGRAEAVDLRSKGLLIEVAPRRRGGFQVLTPHAIASVRGTVWAVDVAAATTAVFVQQGAVAVSRSGAPEATALLRAGDGVDVDAGAGPLQVKRWPNERRLHLLARFGR